MDGNLLVNIPLFAKLPPEQLGELAGMLERHDFKAAHPIFWVGDPGGDFYIIQAGRVTVSCPDEQGKELILADLGPGDFFGEICLLDGGPQMATVRARTDVILGSLNRRDFLTFLHHWPNAADHVISVLGARQREALDRLRGIANLNTVIEERATSWQRVVDMIAAVSASRAFVLLHLAWFAGWMIFNAVQGTDAPDPYPFGLLTMTVSLEAIFLSIFVLISQNRAGQKDRIRADLDYQVNLKAQHEIMRLHEKVDRLAAGRREQPQQQGAVSNGTERPVGAAVRE